MKITDTKTWSDKEVNQIIAHNRKAFLEEVAEGVEKMRKKTFSYIAKPTISADFTAFGGKKIIAGKSYKATSSLSEEDITFNQAIDDVLSHLKGEMK